MLTRIRNGMMARHDQVVMPASNLKMELARILKEEGYIKDFRVVDGTPYSTLVVELKNWMTNLARDRKAFGRPVGVALDTMTQPTTDASTAAY